VQVDRGGFIPVDRVSRTTAPGCTRAGDCTGVLMLASVAAMQGRIAMWHALGEGVAPIKLKTVAAAVFTRPEIATVGISQATIDSGEVPARTIMLPLGTNPRAKMQGLRRGFVKLFCRPATGVVIGGVVVAPVASELILPIAMAVQNNLTVNGLAYTFSVYPSLSGSITEASRQLMRHDDLTSGGAGGVGGAGAAEGVSRPLDGVTVVACEQAVAAPLATRHLADLGARVIKLERPGVGDFARDYDTTVKGMSSHFVWLNRSKESLTLDLKHPAAADVLDRLLGGADVFIQNLAPGAAGRLGLGAEELTERYPRLVHCSVSGYGEGRAVPRRQAYDLLIQSEVGLVSITGTPGRPAKPGIPAADIAAGMYAYSGILSALLQRVRTGRGAVLAVSLFDALAEWMGFPALLHALRRKPLTPAGRATPAIAPYGPYPTAGTDRCARDPERPRVGWRSAPRCFRRPELTRDPPRFADNTARV